MIRLSPGSRTEYFRLAHCRLTSTNCNAMRGWLLFAILLGPALLAAQSPPAPETGRRGPPTAAAQLVDAAPLIDGRLNEEVWQRGTLLTGFLQREPFEGEPASERTELRILYDRSALYI